MNIDAPKNKQITSYKEVKIGRTIYRVTSVYLGEIDLKETLEDMTARKVLAEMMCKSDADFVNA